MNTSTESVMVLLDRIPTEEKAQTRVKVRAAVVRAYTAAMTAQLAEGGLRFPPVILFSDGSAYWLADGFHRVLAARLAGLTEIAAEVRPGTQRDALLFGIGANSMHGLPRTKADKRRAVMLVLADPEWQQWSDREIARRCQVDHKVVSRMRRRASGVKPQMRERKARRGDSVYEMKARSTNGPNEALTPAPPATNAMITNLIDVLGISVPESMMSVFAAMPDFREAHDLLDRLDKVIDRIAQGPAGAVYRQSLVRTNNNGMVGFACVNVRAARTKLVEGEPYCGYCPRCYALQPGRVDPRCKKCGGRGWTTRAGFESCPDWDRQRILKMRPAAAQET